MALRSASVSGMGPGRQAGSAGVRSASRAHPTHEHSEPLWARLGVNTTPGDGPRNRGCRGSGVPCRAAHAMREHEVMLPLRASSSTDSIIVRHRPANDGKHSEPSISAVIPLAPRSRGQGKSSRKQTGPRRMDRGPRSRGAIVQSICMPPLTTGDSAMPDAPPPKNWKENSSLFASSTAVRKQPVTEKVTPAFVTLQVTLFACSR